MHVLFDLTHARALARHPSYVALAALAVIQFPNIDTHIARAGENKAYSFLTEAQVRSVAEAVGVHIPAGVPYNECLKLMRGYVEGAQYLELPFTVDDLVAQVAALGPKEDRPYCVTAGCEPERLTKWHANPQRNTRREDCPMWVHFASGGRATVTDAPPPPAAVAPAKRSPSARQAAGPAPGGSSAAPKPRAASTGAATRPKAGTSTGRVWDFADEAVDQLGDKDMKAVRAQVIAKCEADGINSSTASVQFGKWKSAR